jgi:hypothetical protein
MFPNRFCERFWSYRVSKANPLSDDLSSRHLTGGRNPKPPKKTRKSTDPPPVTFAELDEAHWRIQRIYGSPDGA